MTSSKRLLLMDNDNAARSALIQVVEPLGHSILSTWGGTEALQYLTVERFDLLWMDHHVPDMYAGEFINRVLRIPDHPEIVVMQRPELPPIKYAKVLGSCHFVDKQDINGLLATLNYGTSYPIA